MLESQDRQVYPKWMKRVLSCLLIFLFFGFVTIYILVLLGPYIGEVFSQIVIGECGWGEEVKVWLDENENGHWEIEEQPLENILVQVDDTYNNFESVGAALTDINGSAKPFVWIPGCPKVQFKVYLVLGEEFEITTARSEYRNLEIDSDGPFYFGLAYKPGFAPEESVP